MSNDLFYPLDLSLVSEWPGDRGGGNIHFGTDFAVPVGTPLPAAVDGQIVFAGGDGASGELYPGSGIWANGEALVVDIQRSDGLIVRYAHLSRIDVYVGQWVPAGHIVGLSGNTGFTTGPHLHWELRWDRAWAWGSWETPQNLGAKPFPSNTVDRNKPVEYITKDSNKRKAAQVVKAGVSPMISFTETATAITTKPGDYQLAAEVRAKGKAGTRVKLTAWRYIWNGSKYTSKVYLNETELEIGSNGFGYETFPVVNRVPQDGSRIGIAATVIDKNESVTIERFAVKGHRWEV